MKTWVTRIQKKLADLKQADPEFQQFGAFMHQYRLGPTSSKSKLTKAENSLKLQLPEEFRTFLLYIGNGGAGPGYELQRFAIIPPQQRKPNHRVVSITYSAAKVVRPVEEFAHCFDDLYWQGMKHLVKNPQAASRPFKLVKSIQREKMRVPDDEIAYEEWQREVWDRLADGTFYLADYGCGMTARLVITGRRAGSVWVEDECDGEWFARFGDIGDLHGPLLPKRKNYRFSEWYEHWLDNYLLERAEVKRKPKKRSQN